jgi:hypothetical protein
MAAANTEENLVLELEALKEMRIDMSRCLEAMQLVRKDLHTIAENLEMLEELNKELCHSLKAEKKRTENNTDRTVHT